MDTPWEQMQAEFKAGEAFLAKWKQDNSIRLADKYSHSIRLDISQRPRLKAINYNEVNLVALRGNSQEAICVDLNRDEFIAAVEAALNVRIIENEDIV